MAQEYRKNREIRSQEVRLIDKDSNMIGVVSINEALKLAYDTGLDLVEISPNSDPPVCKIISFSKLKYEEQKRLNLARKKQKVVELKEITMSPNIGEADLNTKIRQSNKFLVSGNKVRFNFNFRGREINYSDLVQTIINKIESALKDVGKIDEKPKLEGKRLFFTIIPINMK